MSEVVVRMEMPKHCGECNLYVNGWCYAIAPDSEEEKVWHSSHKERPPMCPIICALPENHGRLVDVDAVFERATGRRKNGDLMDVAIEICNAPIIVPAERREE